MLGLMRTARNMKLPRDPNNRCMTCKEDWIVEENDPDCLYVDGFPCCPRCNRVLAFLPPRTFLQRLPEALLIASLPVLVMGSAILLLKLLELLFR